MATNLKYHQVAGGIFGHIITRPQEGKMRFKLIISALIAVVAMMGITSSAQAYCGPGFSSKSSAVAYYKGEGKVKVPSMTKWLRAHGFMQRDQSFDSFIRSDKVVFTTTPSGYVLDLNTLCSGNVVKPFPGKLRHSKMGVLAIKSGTTTRRVGKVAKKVTTKVIKTEEVQEKQADGSINVYEEVTIQETTTITKKVKTCSRYRPFMKDYCRNLVSGKKFKKCRVKTKRSKKIRTFKQRKLIKKVPGCAAGSCNSQEQTVKQNCDAGLIWNGQQCVNNQSICSNVNQGSGSPTQGGNCNQICVGTNVCNTTPPPPPPPTCPDGRPVPASGDCDRAPGVFVSSIPHLMAPNANGEGAENGDVYFETNDPDGDVQLADVQEVSGQQYADWSSLDEVGTRRNSESCPTGKTCWKFTLWAKQAGPYVFRIKVTAGGKTVYSENQTVNVEPFQF